MGVFTRENGEWVESDLRARVGSDWTDQYDNGYIRVGSEWVQFQPGAQGALLAPVNLAVTPFDISATGTWQNPSQSVTPTHVQVRCPELTTVWTEYTYPHTSVTFPVLYPSTGYQMQVRYIVRTLGEITATGPIATHFFTTLAPQSPGLPAPDPGGSGGDSVIWWPSTGGTPGPVDGPGCWWEYQVQEFDPDTYIWSDSSLHGEFAGDLGELSIDFVTEGFDCGATLRFKYREICGGTPEAWAEANAFTVPCDWADTCGGLEQTGAFAAAPFTDAVFAMPKICVEDGRVNIEDYIVADVLYGKLSGFDVQVFAENAWGLRAGPTLSLYGEPIVAGHVPGLVPIGSSVPSLTSDFSFVSQFMLDEVPHAGSSAPVKLLEIGKTVKIYAYASGGVWTVTASVPKEGGGSFLLTSTTGLAVGEWHSIGVTIDQDGDKILYIDGEPDVTDSDTTRASFGGFTGAVELYGNDSAQVRSVGGWDRVLSADEMSDTFGGYNQTLLKEIGAMFFVKGHKLTQDNPPIWLTYAEAIVNHAYLTPAPGLGHHWVAAWTLENTAMDWPTFADAAVDDAFKYLGPTWFNAYWAQATNPGYDSMVVDHIGAMFFVAMDELDAGTNTEPVGGTRTVVGAFTYHKLVDNGEVFYSGVATGALTVDYLVVSGGGAGGFPALSGSLGGGGGGGGVIEVIGASLTSDAYPFTKGAGGVAVTSGQGGDGGASSFNGTSPGGGAGGGIMTVAGGNGKNSAGKGSGGGGASNTAGSGGTGGTSVGGYAGGPGKTTSYQTGGGGGGAGEVGSTDGAGEGGDGIEWPTGSGIHYAGGGAGPINYGFAFTLGGSGGGGGTNYSGQGSNGTVDTGGGGAGSRDVQNAGHGAGGCVIVRFLTP